LNDLVQISDKAELLDGRIVRIMPTGRKPGRVVGRIYRSLDDYATATGRGEAYPDNVGFLVPRVPSGRQSFAPDASFFVGPFPADPMRFLEGAPTLAVEVRSERDYGAAAEAELAAKRADYLQAGTAMVWDVDPVAECVHIYQADAPDARITYRGGQVADGGAWLPGWQVLVDWIFP
jgi:Uma2 family endonuclease